MIRSHVVGSLEAEEMSPELYATQVADHAQASDALTRETEYEQEEQESDIVSLESRIESLEFYKQFCGRPVVSTEQAQLMTALSYKAVQNTDLCYEKDVLGKSVSHISQGFENDGQVTFSAESAGSTIKEMGGAVVEKLKQAGKWLYEIVVKVFNLFRDKEKRVKNLKDLVVKGKEASKVGSNAKIRLTGSQVANVGTASDYTKITAVFTNLNGDHPKFKALIDAIEKEANGYYSSDSGIMYFNVGKLGALQTKINDAMSAYTTIFNLKFSGNGSDQESEATAPFVGKRKIKVTRKPAVKKLTEDNKVEINLTEYLGSFNLSLVKDSNIPESMLADVLSISDIEEIIPSLERAITGKVIEMKYLEALARHSFWTGAIWQGDGNTKIVNWGKQISAMSKIVRNVVVAPHAALTTIYQSVTDDYLRYSERSAKLHASGKEAGDEVSGGQGVLEDKSKPAGTGVAAPGTTVTA